jgi:hypothetical protein
MTKIYLPFLALSKTEVPLIDIGLPTRLYGDKNM